MEGFLLSLCIVSAIFNFVMFVWCLKLRNDCIELRDLYLEHTDTVVKRLDDAREELKNASAVMNEFVETLGGDR